jgi:hypothetical protein
MILFSLVGCCIFLSRLMELLAGIWAMAFFFTYTLLLIGFVFFGLGNRLGYLPLV